MDVRTEGEFDGNRVRGAVNVPLANLTSLVSTLDK